MVRKSMHVREILTRVAAIHQHNKANECFAAVGELQIFYDGRDPLIRGESFPLPRREKRILEYLCTNVGRRVTRTQMFNAIYGVFVDFR